MAKYNGSDAWTFERNNAGTVETFNVRVTWYTYEDAAQTFVEIDTPEGETITRSGRAKITRGLAVGGRFGNSLQHPIVHVEFESLFGDVAVSDRRVKPAAQKYASAVLGEILKQRDAEKVARSLQPAEPEKDLSPMARQLRQDDPELRHEADPIGVFVERWGHEPGCPSRAGGDCLPRCKPEEPEPEHVHGESCSYGADHVEREATTEELEAHNDAMGPTIEIVPEGALFVVVCSEHGKLVGDGTVPPEYETRDLAYAGASGHRAGPHFMHGTIVQRADPEPARPPVGRSFHVVAVLGWEAVARARRLADFSGFEGALSAKVLHCEALTEGYERVFEIVLEDKAETRRHYALTGEEVLASLEGPVARQIVRAQAHIGDRTVDLDEHDVATVAGTTFVTSRGLVKLAGAYGLLAPETESEKRAAWGDR